MDEDNKEMVREAISLISVMNDIENNEKQFIELEITQNLEDNEIHFISEVDGNARPDAIEVILNTGEPSDTSKRKKKSTIRKLKNKRSIKQCEESYPVKVASRKVVDKEIFSHYLPKTNPEGVTVFSSSKVKNEIPDNYLEFCNLDGAEGSSLQLEYGSGVNIYESLEVYDCDNEVLEATTKKRKKSTYK